MEKSEVEGKVWGDGWVGDGGVGDDGGKDGGKVGDDGGNGDDGGKDGDGGGDGGKDGGGGDDDSLGGIELSRHCIFFPLLTYCYLLKISSMFLILSRSPLSSASSLSHVSPVPVATS